MSARGLTLVTVVWLCALGGALLLGAPAAWALGIRPYISSFAAGNPKGVAVDQETGNVYVAEASAGVVAVFGADGGPVVGGAPARSQLFSPVGLQVGVAIDNACFYHQPPLSGSECEAFDPSNGDLYVTNSRTLANPEGAVEKFRLNVLMHEYEVVQEFPFNGPRGVAVDHRGDVYVAALEEEGISEFNPSGVKIATIEQSTIAHPAFVAVGALGVVYVGENAGTGGHGVAKLEVGSKGEIERQALLDGEGNGVAVEAHGDVLVDDGSRISEYGPSGSLVGVAGSGRLAESNGVAVDEESQHAYVSTNANTAEAVDVFGGLVAVPAVTTGLASNVTLTSAMVGGEVDPEGVQVTSCRFEYGITTGYGSTAACVPSEVGSGSVPVPVAAELHGLQSGVVYHYRLIAANASISGEPVLGGDRTFATGAMIESESVSEVTASSATLLAQVNPEAAATTYHFEYGTSASYGTSAPVADASIGAGSVVQLASQHVQGLEPNTTYHFRVVASNEHGTVDGGDQAFTTQRSGVALSLPDGREWELVSPPDKHGASLEPIGEQGVIQAAAGGSAISYYANAPSEAEPKGYSEDVQVLSKRGSDGWSSRVIATPHDIASGLGLGEGYEYRFFSSDLSQALVEPHGPFTPLSAEASERTPYVRDDDACQATPAKCYTPLVNAGNVMSGVKFGNEPEVEGEPKGFIGEVSFVGGSADLRHVVLKSGVALTPDGSPGLYEWGDGKLTFIGVGGFGDSEEVSTRHAISDDGSRVIFETNNRGNEGSLFMRDVAKGESVHLDAVQSGASGAGTVEPKFQIASGDGSKVFFTDAQQLTKDSNAQNGEPDLYECQIVQVAGKSTCELSDLTVAHNPGGTADVQGLVLGASEDGSYVYYVADGVLAGGASQGNCRNNSSGACNVYVAHETGGAWTTTFIGTVSAQDGPDWSRLQGHPSGVSRDGRFLAFMSQRSLPGYDTRDAVTGNPDEEVYIYDASTEHVACASCDPTGARPVGGIFDPIFTHEGLLVSGDRIWGNTHTFRVAGNIPGWTPYALDRARYQSRYLSDSGRLFFNSYSALVPQDVNGTWDVYEYEPAGVGDCTVSSTTFSEHSGGCVGLISSGTSPEESAFVDASEGGGDVFFLTSTKLLSQDFDASMDVYDARECTVSSPCLPKLPVPPPACSTGDSCKAAPSLQPAEFGAPSSATFSGAGNISPSSPGVVVPKSLSRAQKLVKALRSCHSKKSHKKRRVCEQDARKRYATKAVGKANRKRGSR